MVKRNRTKAEIIAHSLYLATHDPLYAPYYPHGIAHTSSCYSLPAYPYTRSPVANAYAYQGGMGGTGGLGMGGMGMGGMGMMNPMMMVSLPSVSSVHTCEV